MSEIDIAAFLRGQIAAATDRAAEPEEHSDPWADFELLWVNRVPCVYEGHPDPEQGERAVIVLLPGGSRRTLTDLRQSGADIRLPQAWRV